MLAIGHQPRKIVTWMYVIWAVPRMKRWCVCGAAGCVFFQLDTSKCYERNVARNFGLLRQNVVAIDFYIQWHNYHEVINNLPLVKYSIYKIVLGTYHFICNLL